MKRFLILFIIAALALPGVASARKNADKSDAGLLAVFGASSDAKSAESDSAAAASVVDGVAATGRFQIMTFSTALPVVARAIMEKRLPSDTATKVSDPKFALQVAQMMGASYALCIVHTVKTVPPDNSQSRPSTKVAVNLTLIKSGGKKWVSSADSTIPQAIGTTKDADVVFASTTAASTAVSALMMQAFGDVIPNATVHHASPLDAVTTVTEPERNMEDEYAQAMKNVERYVSDNNLTNAVVELKKAINLKPTKPEPRIQLINLYTRLGMTAQAWDECKRALLFDSGNLVLHDLLAKMSIAGGTLVDAEAQCREMIRLDPKNVEAYLTLGDVSWNQGKPDDAETAFKEAAALLPASPLPYEKLRKLDLARKKYPAALDELLQYKLLVAGPDASARSLAVGEAIQDEFDQIMKKLNAADEDYRHASMSKDDYYQENKDLEVRLDAFDKFISGQSVPDPLKEAFPHAEYAVSLMEQANSYAISYSKTEKKSDSEQATLFRTEAGAEFDLYRRAAPRKAGKASQGG